MQHAAWTPLTAFTASLLVGWWLSRSRFSTFALDHPNDRSLHEAPVPRTGGLAIHAGILLAWMIVSSLPPTLWFALAALIAVSFLDDVRGLPIVARFGVHLLAAGVLAADVLLPQFGVVPAIIVTLAISWMINLYNFMDGSDGLAGGMAAIGFAFYGAAAWMSGSSEFALANFSVAAAAAAFLVFNFHPARLFMGDVGSVPLGFLAGALGLLGWVQGDWSWWFPLLVFSPFIVDASVTLARRLARRERVWEAHRDHYYQRLVQLGWGHRGTAIAEYAVMFVSGTLALMLLAAPASVQAVALLAVSVCYGALVLCVERAWHQNARGVER